MNSGLHCLLILAAVLTMASIARGDESLGKLQEQFSERFDKIGEQYRNGMETLDGQLIKALEAGRETARKAGDLDLVAAFEAEIASRQADTLAAPAPAEVPEIARLRDVYEAESASRELHKHAALVAWHDDYEAKLRMLEKALVAADRIEDAKRARAERDKLRESLTLAEARAAIAAKEAEAPDERPWQDLRLKKWASIDGSEYFLGMFDEALTQSIKFGGERYRPRQYFYAHAPGRIVFEFDEPITGFSARGCLEERSHRGKVVFILETEEGEVFRSEPVDRERREENIEVSFAPAHRLVLKVDEAGGAEEDWAFWLEPKFR